MIAPRVEVGRSLEFVASHVRADGDKLKIWAQVNPEGVHLIEASITTLQPEFESNSGFLHHCQLQIGHIYCVRWGEPNQSKWYRIRILAWPPNNPTTVAVHFIDYGWTDLVSVSNVRHCGELAHIQPQALEFIVADVIPPGNTGVWPEGTLRFFEQHFLYKRVIGLIVGALEGQTVLRLFRSGEHVPFTDILVKQGFAFSNRVIPPQLPHNEMAHYRGETFRALPLDLMKEHLVYVAHIESPQKFFVQLGEKEPEINIMMEAIHIYAQQGSLSPLTTVLPGTPCLAQFSGDGSYYRGIVTHVSGANCQVVFVDYGNSELKHCTELKAIPSEFLSLPLQAYQCSLVGAKSTDGRDLHVQTEGKLLSCHILAQEGTTYVVSLKHQGKTITDYLTPSTPPPSEALKSAGFAAYRYIQLECKRYNVTISYCFSPLEFYVQLSENTNLLDKVMSQLTVCDHSNARLSITECRPKLPVSAKFSDDETWYRGEIISLTIDHGDGQITVRFVDYGNSEVTSLPSLKPLNPELIQVPVQCIRMCLDGFQSMNKDILETPSVVKKFEEFTLEKTLVAQVKSPVPADNIYLVELYDVSANPPLNINKLLADFINNASSPPKPAVIQPPPLSNVERICVTHFVSPSEFFGQLTKFSTDHLEKLQSCLNEKYRSSPQAHPSSVQMGQFVCAQYSGDRLFYRAKVLAARKSEAEVYFVDFGNRELVNVDSIYVLLPEFTSLPQQGILCSLMGVSPSVDSASLEATITDRILEVCLLRQIGDKWEVEMTETHSENSEALMVLHPVRTTGKPTGRTRGSSQSSENSDWGRSSLPPKRADNSNWSNKPPDRNYSRANDSFRSQPARASHSRNADGESDGRLYSGDRFQRKPPKNYNNDEKPRKITKHISSGSSSHEESDWESSASARGTRRGQQSRHPEPRSRDIHSDGSDPESRGKQSFRGERLTDFKWQVLPDHACREVTISYAISPSEFYCQVTEYGAQLDKLMDDIAQTYGSLQPSDLEIRNLRVGMPCCAIYSEDGGWYRAKILCISGLRTEVDFVDYGNREVTTPNKIKELKPEFLSLPAQAVRCCLHNVQPVNGEWPLEVIEKFKETSAEKTFVAQFVKQTLEGWYEVNLLETDKLTSSTLNKEFVNLNVVKLPEWIPLDVSSSTTFTETVIGNGDREDVIVTWIKNPCEFFCQLASSQETFRTMMFNMQERYSLIPPDAGIIETPNVNMPCVAQFSEDNVWYRAQITELKEDKMFVFYVDYGNTDCLPCQNVRHIETQFVQLPMQAIKCQLRGVKPISNDEWCTAKRSIIEKYFEDSIVCTFVASYDSVFLVDLEKEGKSVADELVAAGLAILDSKPCSVTSADSLLGSEKPSIPKLKLDVKPGDSIDVLVSFAESPKLFWCQLQSNSEEVENLVVTLTNYYSQLGDNVQNVVNPSPGTPCAAKFSEDARWYRACVLDRPGPGRLQVLFIDYGNQEVVHHSQCKVLLPEYSELPAQAIKCILPDLPDEVPDDLAKDFVNMVDGEGFAGRVEEVCDESFVLSLFTTTEGQQVNVAHTIFGSVLLNKQPETFGFTLELLPEQGAPSEDHAVSVCHVESVSHFFVRLATLESERLKMSSVFAALDRADSLEDPATGHVCCVKHPETEDWIRVHLISLSDDDAKVINVDSGEEFVVSKTSLKQLPQDLLQYPPFAYECKLDGISPATDVWSPEDTELFKTLVKKEPLIASFLSVTKPFKVFLQNEDGSISEALLEKGNSVTAAQEMPSPNFKLRAIEEGEMLATVYVVVSLEQFYIVPSFLNGDLDALSSRMQEAYEGNEIHGIQNIAPGMPCAAKYSIDGVWYRAILLSTDEELASVRFVDYGNTEVTKPENLKTLDEEFIQDPPFAIECCLSGIMPKENMDIEAQVQFEQLVLEQEVTVRVLSTRQPCQVEILMDSKDIMEELLTTGFFTKLSDLPKSAPSEMITLMPTINYRKCNFAVGQKKQATISFVSDPGEFWIQLSEGQICLEDLMQELQERYGAENEADAISEASPGLPCISKFEDGLWYRAEILDVIGDVARVRYVDHGNEECVALNSLKAIEPDLVVLPKQALKCFLADVEPCEDDGWSLQAIEEFNEELGVGEKMYEVEAVTEVEGSFGVVLSEMGMNVAKKLVAKGIATSKETSEDLATTSLSIEDVQASKEDEMVVLPTRHGAQIVPGLASYIGNTILDYETEYPESSNIQGDTEVDNLDSGIYDKEDSSDYIGSSEQGEGSMECTKAKKDARPEFNEKNDVIYEEEEDLESAAFEESEVIVKDDIQETVITTFASSEKLNNSEMTAICDESNQPLPEQLRSKAHLNEDLKINDLKNGGCDPKQEASEEAEIILESELVITTIMDVEDDSRGGEKDTNIVLLEESKLLEMDSSEDNENPPCQTSEKSEISSGEKMELTEQKDSVVVNETSVPYPSVVANPDAKLSSCSATEITSANSKGGVAMREQNGEEEIRPELEARTEELVEESESNSLLEENSVESPLEINKVTLLTKEAPAQSCSIVEELSDNSDLVNSNDYPIAAVNQMYVGDDVMEESSKNCLQTESVEDNSKESPLEVEKDTLSTKETPTQSCSENVEQLTEITDVVKANDHPVDVVSEMHRDEVVIDEGGKNCLQTESTELNQIAGEATYLETSALANEALSNLPPSNEANENSADTTCSKSATEFLDDTKFPEIAQESFQSESTKKQKDTSDR